jgi:peroxiredoxin
VQIVGASFDSIEANAQFAARRRFAFPLLCDKSRRLGRAYGACGSSWARAPHRISYVIDGAGRIERAYDQVNPRSHAEQVLQDLRQAS